MPLVLKGSNDQSLVCSLGTCFKTTETYPSFCSSHRHFTCVYMRYITEILYTSLYILMLYCSWESGSHHRLCLGHTIDSIWIPTYRLCMDHTGDRAWIPPETVHGSHRRPCMDHTGDRAWIPPETVHGSHRRPCMDPTGDRAWITPEITVTFHSWPSDVNASLLPLRCGPAPPLRQQLEPSYLYFHR